MGIYMSITFTEKMQYIFRWLLGMILPPRTYKGVVNEQIKIYNFFKKENYKAFKEWQKTSKPAVNLEILIDENGKIKKDLELNDLNKFREANNDGSFSVPLAEETILNLLLQSRANVWPDDPETVSYYQKLMTLNNKTLEQVILAIVEWEYIDNNSSRLIKEKVGIPSDFTEKFRKELHDYVKAKLSQL